MGRQLFSTLAISLTFVLFLFLVPAAGADSAAEDLILEGMSAIERADYLMDQARPRVSKELARRGFQLGQPVFMRIFKIPGRLEVWLKKGGTFQLFKTYYICRYSGYTGPKLYEGDWQSPEGFYSVSAEQMNPKSRYHLSFDIGYPNAFDTAQNRTGSAIMVHGNCSSQGCFAMGNKQIEEIYLLAHNAFLHGQERFSLHIFPFELTSHTLAKYKSSPWYGFWKNLQQGYDAFEREHQVPLITAARGSYVVNGQRQLALNEPRNKVKK